MGKFVRKTIPPPECEEGDTLKARLTEIKKETSKWTDDKTGEPKEQFEINFELENGYKGRTWIAFYEMPGDRSALGKLASTLERMTKREINDIEGFLTEFKAYGKFYVKVKGFRETEGGDEYPNFALVTDKLPGMQEKLTAKTEEKTPDLKPVLERFSDAINLGIPLNDNDWNNSLTFNERIALFKQGLAERKEDMYFFTDKAKELLSNAV
jgi:hypothetical protein